MDVVIRLKDERRLVFQDSEGLFGKGEGKKESFKKGKTTVEVWDLSGFELEGVGQKLRVIKFRETSKKQDREEIWLMMHKRWDIEENAFHQLKTYYHAKHCYCHGAVETIFNLMLIGFNLRELYLYHRLKEFGKSGISLKSVSRKFSDELLLEDFCRILYDNSG